MKISRKIIIAGIASQFFILFAGAQTVTVDMSAEHQLIQGFGGVNMPGWIEDLTSDQVEKAFGNNPGQIGLNILRIRIPFDNTAFNLEVPTALRARSKGAVVVASPWTPPSWMKTNNSTIGGRLNPSYYQEYAAHLMDFADFMASNGVPLYAVSLQNEPDIQVNYESCDWSSEEMINFLNSHGEEFDTLRLIVAESFNFNKSMTDPILNEATAGSYVDIIGGHIYGGGLSDYPLARNKGKQVWMTEHLDTATSWAGALATGKEIHDCMVANYNAYIWWYVRRFYGPLDESGNISKRGYVMSQFAKFIRPGFIRIDATANPLSDVYVSAYRKETEMVIVVVNRNSMAADLDFTLQNASIDSLTKYTTSNNKSVLNEGTQGITGNSFSASVDAQSITTYTTVTSNGGRAFNSPPVANAGTYPDFIDVENNGVELVMLDASSSSDPDGTISNYTWSKSGKQIASGKQVEISLPIGKHSILLTITDNDGATDTNLAVINVLFGQGSNEANIWLETECGTVGSNWNIISDLTASGEKYVSIQPGNNSIDNAPQSIDDQIIFTFDVSEPGIYTLWGRTKVPTPDDDSFWIRMDDGIWAKWNNIIGGSSWQWDDVHNLDQGTDAIAYELNQGTHTLVIGYREDGASLDKLYLTNTSAIPSDLGGMAGNCSTTAKDNLILSDDVPGPYLSTNYPNPFTERTLIKFGIEKSGHVNLAIFDVTGRLILILIDEILQPGTHTAILKGSNLKSGVYYYRLQSGDFTSTRRMIITK